MHALAPAMFYTERSSTQAMRLRERNSVIARPHTPTGVHSYAVSLRGGETAVAIRIPQSLPRLEGGGPR